MKYFYTCLYVATLVIISTSNIKAQDMSIKDFNLPTYPAFTILGIQPTEILSPKTETALEITLLNNFFKNGSIDIPNNMALEFNLSNLFLKSTRDYNEYMESGYLKPCYEKINVSFAITEKRFIESVDSTYKQMGFGVRMNILEGSIPYENNANNIKLIKNLKTINDLYNKLSADADSIHDNTTCEKYIKDNYATLSSLNINIETIKTMKYNTISTYINKIVFEQMNNFNSRQEVKAISDFNPTRYGFILDFAAATAFSASNNFKNLFYSNAGAWLNATYRFNNDNEISGLLRYLNNNTYSDTSNNVDVGVSAKMKSNKISLNLEAMGRYKGIPNQDAQWDSKLTLTLSYQYYKDVVISYTFGKNYEHGLAEPTNIISSVTLNFGLGQQSFDPIKK